jgi:hypothetical protein
MTAKEKAIELFDRFYGIEPVQPIYIGMDKGQAKQCALICVDEMLALDLRFFDIEFLKEVKQEINKL